MTVTHGLSRKHPLYERWKGMRARCGNPAHAAYDRYGGRGIRVCARWDDFTAFLEDVGHDWPGQGFDLHRLDNDGDYEPGNCVWLDARDHRALPKSEEHREAIGAAHRGRLHSEEHRRRNGLAHRAVIDPDWLRQARAEGRSLRDIGAEVGMHRTTVARVLEREGIR